MFYFSSSRFGAEEGSDFAEVNVMRSGNTGISATVCKTLILDCKSKDIKNKIGLLLNIDCMRKDTKNRTKLNLDYMRKCT